MKLPAGLTKADITNISELVDSPHWRPLVKMLGLKQMEIAQAGLMLSPDMDTIHNNRGQVAALKWVEDTVRSAHKRDHEKRKV